MPKVATKKEPAKKKTSPAKKVAASSKKKAVIKDEEQILDPVETDEADEKSAEDLSEAEIYDEMMGKQMDREIIRSQRKQTAGVVKDKKSYKEEAAKATVKGGTIEIPNVITVKEFAEKTGIGAAKVIGELMKNGILANINQQIDFDTAQIIADDLNVKVKKKMAEGSAEDVFKGNLDALLKEEDSSNLETRPPIVVVMGHVDHGKTTLLDHIRESNVVEGESGGITQHIAAYQVEKNERKITFLDTPGHEAFTAMRARGAKVTDVAILVVAADEGVKPQTIEAIQHAQDAGVPIIVAVNKIDKDGADPDRVKGELGEYDLIPEEWGGKTPMVPVSAKTGEGMSNLLEMILLVSDVQELKANPNRPAIGTVIEAHLDKSLGPVATIVVNSGTLRIMDNLVIGETYGRVKTMKDHNGKNVKTAGPSTPVFIAGITETPQSGDIFQVVTDEKTARSKALNVRTLKEAEILANRGVGEIMSQISAGDLKQLKLVLKTDTKGSLEALKQAIADIKHEDVGVKVILSGVGNVTESDVMMAAAGQGIVMAFHADVNLQVKKVAEREGIEVLQYTVIYKLIDDIKKILTGLLEPEVVETITGKAEVKQIFLTKKKEMIVGCKVTNGHMEKVKVRVFRKEEEVGEGKVETLKIVDDKVNEVPEGKDCGILYTGFMPLEEGDILEGYKQEKRVRTL
ncbi:translation initiation factor IF-2 [Pseudomonadota bacterium]